MAARTEVLAAHSRKRNAQQPLGKNSSRCGSLDAGGTRRNIATALPALSSSPQIDPPTPCHPKQDAWASQRPIMGAAKEDNCITQIATKGGPWWIREERGPSGSWWRGGPKLGQGSYGNVYKAMDIVTGEALAVKQAAVDRSAGCDVILLKELELLKKLRHAHIVSYLGHEYVDGLLCICLEYMSGGTLRDVVNEFGPMDGQLLQRATRGVLEGLDFLHSRQPLVVHRDLKGANVLVDHRFVPKLADFGCSTFSADCLKGSLTFSCVGSVPWMAPEVMNAEQSKKRGGGRRADVWSLGCLVLELATAENPWGKNAFSNKLQAYTVIGRSDQTPPIPSGLSDTVKEFVGLCLKRDPSCRPWCSELIQNTFVDVSGLEVMPF